MALVLLAGAALGAEAPPDERIAAYQEFRHAFDAGEYSAALPLAQRVVELTRSQYGNEAQQLANPLTNLGTPPFTSDIRSILVRPRIVPLAFGQPGSVESE